MFDTEISTISEGSYVGAYERLQAINAEYYNITDVESWPIAGLLVLLDSRRQPVRAELHLYEDLPEQVRDAAIRQGRLLLENRYFNASPIALRIMKSYQWRDTLQIQPNGAIAIVDRPEWFRDWRIAAAVGVLLLVIVLGSGIRSLGNKARATATPASGVSGESTGVAPVTQAVSVPSTVTVQTFAAYPVTNNLPVSTRANNTLAIGQRIRVPHQPPGMTLTLRSAPGATAGVRLGFLQDSQEATIINGPVWTEGENDTIVWWLVRLDEGVQAWAPANTSDLTLLEPASTP